MELLPTELQDLAVLRRLIFASVYLPRDMPEYWSMVTRFGSNYGDKKQGLPVESVKMAIENIEFINKKAFVTDIELISEIHSLRSTPTSDPLGVVLISSHSRCKLCDGVLLIRSDRPSHVSVYTKTLGTVIGTHYQKYCQNFCKGCNFKQYYGYSSKKGINGEFLSCYDSDWAELQYFISSSETAVELSMLKNFDAELLFGQISYSQKAEIYDHCNGYPVKSKTCSTLKKEELPIPPQG